MGAALRYELVRVTTIRSTRIMAVLSLLMGLGLGWLASQPSVQFDEAGNPLDIVFPVEYWLAFSVPLLLVAVLASVVGAQALGQEYRFGLVRLTLTAFPARGQVLTAKALVVAATAAVLALVSYVGSFLAVTLRGQPLPPAEMPIPDGTYLLRGIVFVVLWALSAFAIAGLTRQTALGIAVPIVSGLIVEQILAALLHERARWLVDVLPWSSAARWDVVPLTPESDMSGGADLLTQPPVAWAAVGVFAVWVVALLALEVVAFLRRDA